MSRWPPSLVALQHRNFRLLWAGLLLSFSGSMMQNAALLWHVSILVRPEQRPLALGTVGLVRVVPIVVFSLVGNFVRMYYRYKAEMDSQVAARINQATEHQRESITR